MTLLLIIPAWTILLSLVAGLCMAARIGDRDQRTAQTAEAGWESAEHVTITARTTHRPTAPAESGQPLVSAGSIAA